MGTILLLSGPSLALLGEREPERYGTATLDELVALARGVAEEHGHSLDHLQSDEETELVKAINNASGRYDAIVINAAALTHYSEPIAVALDAFNGVSIELHITNPHAREEWRRVSLVSPVVTGTIAGFGGFGYRLALEAASEKLRAS